MSRRRRSTRSEDAADAEFALKAHALCDKHLGDEIPDKDMLMQQIAEAVDLTEAPEDAVCTLVIGLMKYCREEEIDWNQDVMARALRYEF